MNYKAWSDGSFLPGKKIDSYISYVIENPEGEKIVDFQAKALDIYTSEQAEIGALLLLIKNIKEMGLQNVEILSDSTSAIDFVKRKEIKKKAEQKKKKELFGDLMNEVFIDEQFFEFVQKNLKWHRRKGNKAHRNFKKGQKLETVQIKKEGFLLRNKRLEELGVKKLPLFFEEDLTLEKRFSRFAQRFEKLPISSKGTNKKRVFQLEIESELVDIYAKSIVNGNQSVRMKRELALEKMKEVLSRAQVVNDERFQGFVYKNQFFFVNSGKIVRIISFVKKKKFDLLNPPNAGLCENEITFVVKKTPHVQIANDLLQTDMIGMNIREIKGIAKEGIKEVDQHFLNHFLPLMEKRIRISGNMIITGKKNEQTLIVHPEAYTPFLQSYKLQDIEEIKQTIRNKWTSSIQVEGPLGVLRVCGKFAFSYEENELLNVFVDEKFYTEQWKIATEPKPKEKIK